MQREESHASMGPLPHHWSISSVKAVNAVVGSTSTSMLEVTFIFSLPPHVV